MGENLYLNNTVSPLEAHYKMPEHTTIQVTIGDRTVSVSRVGTNLSYLEFMDLVESLINHSGYSQHEIESYILEWAEEINQSRNN